MRHGTPGSRDPLRAARACWQRRPRSRMSLLHRSRRWNAAATELHRCSRSRSKRACWRRSAIVSAAKPISRRSISPSGGVRCRTVRCSPTSILPKAAASTYWHVQHFPIPRQEIETHSANMHMIAATPAVERALKSVRVGQIVKLTGYLVEVRAADGWTWRSSLTREDTGAGACELVWVTEFDAR